MVVLIVTLFALFNAPAIWGENYPQMQTQLMIYLVAVAYFIAVTNKRPEIYDISLITSVTIFFLAFFLSLAVFRAMPFKPAGQNVATTSFALIFTHVFVVAANEEILFRSALPDLIPLKGMGAQGVSAVLFGLFHWTAYGADLNGIAFAVFAGLIFGFIADRWETGLVAAIGVHAAWNLFALGAVGIF